MYESEYVSAREYMRELEECEKGVNDEDETLSERVCACARGSACALETMWMTESKLGHSIAWHKTR